MTKDVLLVLCIFYMLVAYRLLLTVLDSVVREKMIIASAVLRMASITVAFAQLKWSSARLILLSAAQSTQP